MQVWFSTSATDVLSRVAKDPGEHEKYHQIAHSVDLFKQVNGNLGRIIAIIESRYDLILVFPSSPGYPILFVYDPWEPEEVDVADLIDDTKLASRPSYEIKTYLANRACSSLGIVTNDIHIV